MPLLNKIKQELALKGESVIHCRIIPSAPKSEIKKIMSDGMIKIAIAGPSEKGKANKELVDFLSKNLTIPRFNISIISGGMSRNKLIKLINI